jgi:hypothetical protein
VIPAAQTDLATLDDPGCQTDCGGHFNHVEACLLNMSQRFIEREDANLLAILVDDADLDSVNLAVGARTARTGGRESNGHREWTGPP